MAGGAHLDLNFTSATLARQAAVLLFRRQGVGKIVNVGSISARIGGTSGTVVHAVAKAALATSPAASPASLRSRASASKRWRRA